MKKPVKPLRNDNIIRMYVCGPTVYDYSHIGHFKTFIVYDSMVRLLKFLGYDVLHVVNITDIDDKIIDRANREGVTYRDISEKYTRDFMSNWIKLNLLVPYAMPRATYHIKDMIEIIEELIHKGYAYVSGGNVYFSVEKFKNYGEISGQKIEELIRGYRVDEPGKRDPLDFALWKEAKDGEPSWRSPWGNGRPGWHIECTAMSTRFLDPPFEIHGGGEDLKFPHHENERAQTNSYIGDEAVYIWTHVGVLRFKEEKMSKSIGNIVLIRDLVNILNPDIIRLLVLSTHYRKQLDYSEDKLREVQNIYRRILSVYNKLIQYGEVDDVQDDFNVDEYREKFMDSLLDDFNTATALNIFMSFVDEVDRRIVSRRLGGKSRVKAIDLFQDFRYIYGLRFEVETPRDVDKLVEKIVEVRRELRKRKIYDLADMIREALMEVGYRLEDIGDKTVYYRI